MGVSVVPLLLQQCCNIVTPSLSWFTSGPLLTGVTVLFTIIAKLPATVYHTQSTEKVYPFYMTLAVILIIFDHIILDFDFCDVL